jgi:hypothetical protein
MSCASISSTASIYATNNIEAVGNMVCRSMSTIAADGISVYNGATLNASMQHTRAITGTTLTITNESTSATPLLVKSFALQNICTVGNNDNFDNLGNIATNIYHVLKRQ